MIKKESPKGQLRAFEQSSAHNQKLQRHRVFLSWPLAVCKLGGRFILLLVEVRCRWCGLRFCVCRGCWRGQAYCSGECRILARRHNHREAQRRYRQTPRGKKAHREAENRRRHGIGKKNEKNMDDPSSTFPPSCCMTLLPYARLTVLCARQWRDRTGRCQFCGRGGVIVDRFPRRGYGGSRERPCHLV
jgi:hypothetical protein